MKTDYDKSDAEEEPTEIIREIVARDIKEILEGKKSLEENFKKETLYDFHILCFENYGYDSIISIADFP